MRALEPFNSNSDDVQQRGAYRVYGAPGRHYYIIIIVPVQLTVRIGLEPKKAFDAGRLMSE